MDLSQSISMRTELRQHLTPRMIQSMEILQLPMMALEERIEQELQNNPVLEQREAESDTLEAPPDEPQPNEEFSEDEQALVLKDNANQGEDFDRLTKLSEYLENEEFATNGSNFRTTAPSLDGERDKKLDAMNNAPARSGTLADHLLDQWAFVEAPLAVKAAGEILINYIDAGGYLRVSFE